MKEVLRGLHEVALIGLFNALLRTERSPFNLRHSPGMRCLKSLLQSQWYTPEQLTLIQVGKAKRLLRQAYEDAPYYRKAFERVGFHPEDFSRMEQLSALPVLTKSDIQNHRDELLCLTATPGSYYRNQTGGSTGHPLVFCQSWEYEAWGLADIWRNFMMCGFRPGERKVFLWGSDYDSRAHRGWKNRVVQDLLRENTVWINTFELTEERLAEAARTVERFRPRLIVAYVSSATLLASYIREHGIKIRPRAIQTSAEVLSGAQRRLLEEVFACPVFDRYGCREVGNIAHECEAHEGLHLLEENNYTEFLDDAGLPVSPGETGTITVTNLNNSVMPLIRYQPGDLGRPAAGLCSCGRGLARMEVVDGRTADVIRSPSGKLLHGEFFTHLFYKLAGVRQFQVVQTSLERVEIRIVPMRGFDKEHACRFLSEAIREHGDPAFQVTVTLYERIPSSASGKYRFVYSELTTCTKERIDL